MKKNKSLKQDQFSCYLYLCKKPKYYQHIFNKTQVLTAGSDLESKGVVTIFQKMAKNVEKRGKYLKIWAEMYKI